MAVVRPALFLACLAAAAPACSRHPAADDAGPLLPDGDLPGTPDAGPADAGPVGACECPVELAYPAAGATSVELRGNFIDDGWLAGAPMTLDGDRFVATLTLPHGRVLHYKFFVDNATWVADTANPISVGDGFGGRNSALVVDCGCGETYFDWRDAILYFVMLDRFANGDPGNDRPVDGVDPSANFAGGDLAGLLATIESGYFDQLGINAIWISAPLDAGDGSWVGDDGHLYTGYHGYWPSDLGAVEARLGDAALLREVTDAAHRRGIRVVMDYVMNHVHQDSPAFAEHPEWFWPLDDGSGWCVCGDGCEWEGPEGLRCWFRSYLPDFDFTRGDARWFSTSNAIEWIKRAGLDGFRLDAVKHIETSWITELRARINDEIEFSGQVFYLVGETYTGDRGQIRSYVSPDHMLDGQFDFPLRAEILRTVLMRQGGLQDLANFMAANDGFYGVGSVMSTFVGNHDLPRVIHVAEDAPLFSEWDSGKARGWNDRPTLPAARAPFERLALGFTIIFTLPGVPLVYYGDEIGMAGGGDPDNRRPMQWDGVGEDQAWLRARVSALAAIRAAHPALRRGARATLGSTTDALTYRMVNGDDVVTIAINRADWANESPGLEPGDYRDLVTGADVTAPLSLPPRSAAVLVVR